VAASVSLARSAPLTVTVGNRFTVAAKAVQLPAVNIEAPVTASLNVTVIHPAVARTRRSTSNGSINFSTYIIER